jgi:galactokinase/mevalonate kinase-like predicted kinase
VSAGAVADKVSGAGGSIAFMVEPLVRIDVLRRLAQEEGQGDQCSFAKRGTEAWR